MSGTLIDPASPGLWTGVAFSWLAGSVAWRRWRGMPLVARARAGSTFVEGWASARAGTGLVARLGTARNCMHVQVDAQTLRIHPHFPFTLGFMPELYDLDQVIPLDRVLSATILGGQRAQAVEVRHRLADGGEGVVMLLLRRADDFVRTVHAGRSVTSTSSTEASGA